MATFPKLSLALKNSENYVRNNPNQDATYASLLNATKRIQGTLALVSPSEGNFNEHNKTWRPKPGTKYMKLPHGRITVSDENVRMQLHIRRDESIIPARAIEAESGMASNFVDFVEELS